MKTTLITILSLALCTLASRAKDTERSPELSVLDRFVGIWDVDVTIKPAGGEKMSYKAVSTRSWSVGGTFLRIEDTNDENPHQPEDQFLFTYDAKAKNYPGVMMNGPARSEVSGTWNPDTLTMTFTVDSGAGNTIKTEHRFIGKDRAASKGVLTDATGKILVEFTWSQTRRRTK